MGGEGNLKHVVHKRVHLERQQPAARKKLGHLEKHKDYVERAKDFHKKEKTIFNLRRRAAFKNPDEFAFGMVSHKFDDKGQKIKVKRKKDAKFTPEEEEKLKNTQNAAYVGFREQTDKRAISKRMENLHFLDAGRQNKHTLFVDEDELKARGSKASSSSSGKKRKAPSSSSSSARLQDFDVASHLETHPALLGKSANRLRQSQLERLELKETDEMLEQKRAAYAELRHRQLRAEQLTGVREALELQKHLRGKGQYKKVAEATETSPAQYLWKFKRQR
eukprot:CAMPEP_0206454178 /NCGR_PEP_ID=MMETSP0324_2-20121206/20985_1 /ASSEMBLY_ACC=CAM_ASM_000836 /TAXON_ID=2866 /ORGANISM="Crypthecodinium cohnii, Strain Seligo" /LENGTH=276 /DNA_ID=CAMNT_0053924607 /DNA_START=85 /DNA_END=915 /DNA_ORIENTATION=-